MDQGIHCPQKYGNLQTLVNHTGYPRQGWEKPYSSFVGQKCWAQQFFTPNSQKLLVLARLFIIWEKIFVGPNKSGKGVLRDGQVRLGGVWLEQVRPDRVSSGRVLTSPVCVAKVREPPDIAESHSIPQTGEDKLYRASPVSSLIQVFFRQRW